MKSVRNSAFGGDMSLKGKSPTQKSPFTLNVPSISSNRYLSTSGSSAALISMKRQASPSTMVPLISEYLFKDHQTQQDPRDDTIMLCKQLGIDPQSIKLKHPNDFAIPDETTEQMSARKGNQTNKRQNLIDIRFYHYN